MKDLTVYNPASVTVTMTDADGKPTTIKLEHVESVFVKRKPVAPASPVTKYIQIPFEWLK